MTTRRDWLVTLGAGACSLGVPTAASTQAAAGKRRIAVLSVSTAADTQHLWALFRSGLRDLGWIEGDNVVLDMRFAESEPARAYGTDLKENVKRLAPLVDRILKGADPARIPVEQPNVYELVVNLRTARTLGIELARVLLLQASSVIK